MVGKKRGLDPNVGGVRMPGRLRIFRNTKLDRWVARSWQKGHGADTPARKAAREEFAKVVKLIKLNPSTEVINAQQLTENTAWLTRDAMMSAAYGKAYFTVDINGYPWVGVRVLFPAIQSLLNSMTNIVGSIIIRGPTQWVALTPVGTTAGQVLTSNGEGSTPDWQDPPPSGVQTVTPSGGITATITGTDLELQLTAIGAHKLLANITGSSAVPVANSLSDILDMIAGTSGQIMYRGASGWVSLSLGTVGQIIASDGTQPYWATPGGGGVVTEPSLGDFLTVPAHPGFDPAMIYNASITLSNNNKDAQPSSSSPYNYAYGTPAKYTGKLYFEFNPASTSFEAIGICGSGAHFVDLDSGSPGNFGEKWPGQIGWTSGGAVKATPFIGVGAVTLATYASWSAGQRLSFAVDLDAKLMWFRVTSGNWNNSGAANPATGAGGLSIPMLYTGAGNRLVWPGCNMGNTSKSSMYLLAADFTQSVPSGFSAWGA